MHAGDHSLTVELPDEAATLALGGKLATLMRPGLKLFLEGDLGSGKTTLVRGILRALGSRDKVKSPTYTLVEPHAASGLHFFHFDFYRLNHADEFLDAGLDEYLAGAGVCLVEWPEKAAPHLPAPDLRVAFELHGSGRKAAIQAGTVQGQACLKELDARLG